MPAQSIQSRTPDSSTKTASQSSQDNNYSLPEIPAFRGTTTKATSKPDSRVSPSIGDLKGTIMYSTGEALAAVRKRRNQNAKTGQESSISVSSTNGQS